MQPLAILYVCTCMIIMIHTNFSIAKKDREGHKVNTCVSGCKICFSNRLKILLNLVTHSAVVVDASEDHVL